MRIKGGVDHQNIPYACEGIRETLEGSPPSYPVVDIALLYDGFATTMSTPPKIGVLDGGLDSCP